MEIYITREGQRHGPYSPDDVINHIKNGDLNRDDLAWCDGCADWMPLSMIPGLSLPNTASRSAPPPPRLPTALTPIPFTAVTVEPPKKSSGFLDLFKSDISQQPAININVNKKGCGSGCGTVFVFLVVLGGIMSFLEDKKPAIEDTPVPAGNIMLGRSEKMTTAEKDMNLSKSFGFRAKVDDVLTSNKLKVEIDSGNYADVTFKNSSNEILDLKPERIIEFTATVKYIGTGIFIRHELINADLTKVIAEKKE